MLDYQLRVNCLDFEVLLLGPLQNILKGKYNNYFLINDEKLMYAMDLNSLILQ